MEWKACLANGNGLKGWMGMDGWVDGGVDGMEVRVGGRQGRMDSGGGAEGGKGEGDSEYENCLFICSAYYSALVVCRRHIARVITVT